MKFIEQLKSYKQRREQNIENKKVISKLKADYQNRVDLEKSAKDEQNLNILDTVNETPVTLISEKEQSKPEVQDINDQTRLMDKVCEDPVILITKQEQSKPEIQQVNEKINIISTVQPEALEADNELDDKDITKPINYHGECLEINKLTDNVLKLKQKYVDSTKKFIENVEQIEE